MAELCKKCLYSCEVNVGEAGEMLRACTYILHTGKRRPCKAGEECTVFCHAHDGTILGQTDTERHTMKQRKNAEAFWRKGAFYGNSQ